MFNGISTLVVYLMPDLIYYHPQTVVSQLFSVARPVRCFKLGLKPSWLNISLTPYARAVVILSLSEGIFLIYLSTYILSDTWSAQFLRRTIAFQCMWQPANFPHKSVLLIRGNIYIYIYIYSHPQTDCFVVLQLFSMAWPVIFFKLDQWDILPQIVCEETFFSFFV